MSDPLGAPPAIEVIDARPFAVGECPLWDHRDRSIWWIDVRGPSIHRRASDGRTSDWSLADEIGSIGLAYLADGRPGLLVAGRGGIALFDPASGAIQPIADPEPDLPRNRINDGKVDRRGRFWAGSLEPGRIAACGNLWRLDPDCTTHRILKKLTIPNGIVWSPDERRMYLTESPTGRIDVCDFDAQAGSVSNRRPFATVATGRGIPDGAAIDIDGCLWSAHFNGWCVTRYTPAGAVDRVINLPVRTVTSCTFGGDRLDTLFITTSAVHVTDTERMQQPLAGCVLAVNVATTGLAEFEFGVDGRSCLGGQS